MDFFKRKSFITKIISALIVFSIFVTPLYAADKYKVYQDGENHHGFVWTPKKLTYKGKRVRFASKSVRYDFLFEPKTKFFLFPKSFTLIDDMSGNGYHLRHENRASDTNLYVFNFGNRTMDYRFMNSIFKASQTATGEIINNLEFWLIIGMISGLLRVIAAI